MTNPTTPFSWQMPTSSDLVTDLPADFETFGQAVATSMADLLGGTTGQVLSKASNTDMDFTWVTSDDANAIQNAIVDAKGDLIAATAADTPARLAVGNNGENLVADSSASTGLRWQSNFAAGKNKLINGDFGVWQRGTSFSLTGSTIYSADRWATYGVTGDTLSQQTFTAGTAPVAGYEGTFYARLVTGSTASPRYFYQKIEDVRTFAGQTVTLSFWARVSSGTGTVDATLGNQNFGSGGSSFVGGTSQSFTATTSWQRFSFTGTVASVAGKTIGAGSFAEATLSTSNTSKTMEFWGVQLEAGSVATAFQTATGTIQGELAACQRYYNRYTASGNYSIYASSAMSVTSTSAQGIFSFPVEMRTPPASIDSSNLAWSNYANAHFAITSPTLDTSTYTTKTALVYGTVSGATAGQIGYFGANNTTSSYLGFSAEL